MSRWKDHSFCQLSAKIFVFLMVIQGLLFWEVSKEYKWYPEKFSRNFSRIIGFFGPNAAHASVQFKTLTSVTCIRKKGEPITETFSFSGYSGSASLQLINGDLENDTVVKVSSAIIAVNGQVVFGPSDFNQNVNFLAAETDVLGENNTLEVTLKGKPDGQVTINVLQEIHPPVIISDPLAIATEDEPYTYDVDATDQDIGDTITFSLDDFPSGMTIHSDTGLIQWAPGNLEVGSHTVTVRAKDSEGLSDTQGFEITVININDPPQITSAPVTVATEDELYSYDVEATDPDVGDVLAYSLGVSPADMTIDPATGLIQWIPDDSAAGSNAVTVRVQDTEGLFDTQSFQLNVIGVNDPPTITSTPETSATLGQPYIYDVEATDPNSGDVLTFSLDVLPAGMTIEDTTGLIEWAPENDHVGSHTVIVFVSDGHGGTDSQEFNIEVAYVGECLDGQTRICSNNCGTGMETCVDGAWQACDAPEPEEEICDTLDNDCDGAVDEGVTLTFYADADEDGFGDPSSSTEACTAPLGFVTDNQDCDDSNPAIHPEATEIADNGVDEDCDGEDLINQYGEVWFVAADALSGGDGLSWATAFDRIETALMAASEDDEIWVKAGTYHLTDTVSIDKVVYLFGGFAGFESNRGQRDWQSNVTTVSGEFFKGVGFRITADAALSGFTVTKFWSGLQCGGPIERQGGAITIENASPTISHCTFVENRGEYAGAIYTENTSPEIADHPVISECIFMDNSALNGGGAVYNRNCSPTFSSCSFTGNMGQWPVMENFGSSPVISNCAFVGNHPVYPYYPIIMSHQDSSPMVSHSEFTANAGIVIEIDGTAPESTPLIDDCSFTGNNPQAVRVESVYNTMPVPVISNSRFFANHGLKYHGAWGSSISVEAAAATITRCLFERNHSYFGAVNISHDRSVVDIRDSIFGDNVSFGGALVNQDGPQVNILNSLFTGNVVNCAFNRTCGGGAIYNVASSPLIVNSTFSGNRTQFRLGEYVLEAGAISNNSASAPTIVNSIFSDNGPKDIWDPAIWVSNPSAAVTHSIIGFYDPSLGMEANHNVDADPNFVDMARDNYRLFPDSPAVDAGATTVPGLPGLPATDLDGNSRIVDGDEDGTVLPDMGAYEYNPGAISGPLAPPPSNTAPVAKADAKMEDEYNLKDYQGLQEHRVGDTIQLDGSGSRDENGDPLTYHWSFVHIPTRSAAILSDPNDAQSTFFIDANGVYALRLVVNDGLLDSEPDFLVIYTLNRVPVISPAPDITVNVGEPVQLNTDYIHDPDGDPLTYQWCLSPGWPNYSELPGNPAGSNVTVDSFRGPNPTFVPDMPGVYSFIIRPFDGYSFGHQCIYPSFFDDHIRCDYQRVYAQVSTNTPPQITSIPIDTATVGGYAYDITIEDPDDSSVFFTLDAAPSGMFIDHYNPTRVRWNPTADQLGEHDVIIRAVDQRGSYSFQQFTITVSNEPPAIVSNPVSVATERVLYTYQVQATDPDYTYLMRFYLNESPQGMSIHSATGLIQWTPTSSQVGDHPVTVRVEDIAGFSDTQSFTIHVKDNGPPVILSSPGLTAAENELYAYGMNIFDEGEALAFSLEFSPGGMVIGSTGLITWTPSNADVGSHNVVVQVTDAVGLTTSQTFTLTVNAMEMVDGDGDSFSENDGDCDDSDPAIHPGAFDKAANDVDEDCDGADAETSIQITTGQTTVDILQDTESHVGYAISFRCVDTSEYHIQFAHTVMPNDGTLAMDTAFPLEATTTGSKSWHVGATATGSTLGTYEVTTLVTVVETGQTDQVTILINVISGEESPVLHPLGSVPDAISISMPTDVLFTTVLSGPDLKPIEIVVEEVNDFGNLILTLGGLVDDGTAGDLSPDDYVYSGTFSLESNIEGELYFRVRAIFPDMTDPVYSDTYVLGSTRFPVDIKASDMSRITADPDAGKVFLSNEVLVSFVEGTDPDTIEAIVASIGGSIVGTIYGLGYYQVEIPDTFDANGVNDAISNLESNSLIQTAEPVYISSVNAVTPNDTDFSVQWGISKIRADEAWVIARGDAMVVAVIDSGVDYDHPDLENKIIKGRNYFAPSGQPEMQMDPRDEVGHGTPVAGIVAAETDNAEGLAGVAWKSKILAIKTHNAYGHGPEAAAVSGIKYAADRGAKIINLSFGSLFSSSAQSDAIEYASSRGALVIAGSGNDATSQPFYPAAYPAVVAVGATDSSDTRWPSSNYGNWVDLAAPGTDIFSTMPTYHVKWNNPPYFYPQHYASLTGTSFAGPMVAGAAAVVWSNHPSWTARQVRDRLEKTAQPIPEEHFGHGIIDLFEALFNGSFESGDLDEWKARSFMYDGTPSGVAPVARVGLPTYPLHSISHRFRVGPNQHTAYLDNGDGSSLISAGFTAQTVISQSFDVQPGVASTAFSFDFWFVTEETAYNYGCWFDGIIVRVIAPSGTSPFYWMKTYLDFPVSQYLHLDMDIGDSGIGEHPFQANSCPWGTIAGVNGVIALPRRENGNISFAEGPGEYTIEISIFDGMDQYVDSAVLIDNISFR